MYNLIKLYVNISIESISFIFMLILLVACLLQQRRSQATNIFVGMVMLEMLLLLIQIVQWEVWESSVTGQPPKAVELIMGGLYCVDFSLVYFEMLVFYLYISARVKELQQYSSRYEKVDTIVKYVLLAISVAACLLFTSSLWTGSVFFVDETGYGHYTVLYLILLHSSIVPSIACIAAILINGKKLGFITSFIMLFFVIARQVVVPIDILNDTSFSYVFLAIEIVILYFGVDMRRNQQLMAQEIQLAVQNAELERKNVQVMVSQIQPHFLYNTLSVIDYLCGKDVELARTAINAFSDYLRMNMESISSAEPVPFEKELEHTKTYLWIEEMRFSDILRVEYDIEVSDFMIPPLSLQPLCENAVKHGVRGRESGGTVRISTRRNGNTIFIHVEDDGMGFDVNQKYEDNRIHVGIENVRRRLDMVCGGRLDITSRPGIGTIATIVLEEKP